MRERLPYAGLMAVLTSYAALYSVGGADPLIVVLCALALIACWFHGRLAIAQRALLPLAFPAMVVLLYPPNITPLNSSFVGPGSFRVATIVAAYLLILIVRKHDFNGKLILAGGSITLLIACGMRADGEIPYGVLCLLEAILLALYLRQLGPPVPRKNWLGTVLAFVPVIAVAVVIALAARYSETQLGSLLNLFSTTPVSMQFATRSPLDGMQRSAGQDQLVLRLISQAPSNYLVARSYGLFTKGEVWDSPPGESRPLPRASQRLEGQNTFLLASPRSLERVDRVEFLTAAGGQLLSTRDAWLLAADLETVERTASTGLHFKGAPGFPGVFWLGRGGNPPVGTEPPPYYLELPPDLPPVVARLGAELTASAPTPLAKAAAIEAYLQDNFQYGFGYPFQKGSSALEQFLEKHPPAHCEFFATAMVMMLRAQKVPARYVVGFIVDPTDYNDLGGFYAVRSQHAHAWVEVFLEGSGWVTYDPTPPEARIPQRSWWRRWFSQVGDLAMFLFMQARNFFRLSPAEMLRSLLAFVSHPITLAILVLVVVLYYGWRLRWQRGGKKRRGRERAEGRLGELLERFERRLSQHQLERPEHWTLLEWAARLEHPELSSPARQFLETYCRARYGALAAEDELSRLLGEVEAIKPVRPR
ncbi:DUF4129 domain-containing protein [bacterium CPR1]|nr:DUF4129 domain-containing protein [bacterium CPR1]